MPGPAGFASWEEYEKWLEAGQPNLRQVVPAPQPRRIMTQKEFEEEMNKPTTERAPSGCPLGKAPVHFTGPDGKVYLFNTVEELITFQKRMWPEIYDPDSPQFKARIAKSKAVIEFEKKFDEAYGDFKYYGQLTDKIEQAKQEGLKVLEETGDLTKASQVAAEKVLPVIQQFVAEHPGAGIAYALNRGQISPSEIQAKTQVLDQVVQARGIQIPQFPLIGIGVLVLLFVGVLLWRRG